MACKTDRRRGLEDKPDRRPSKSKGMDNITFEKEDLQSMYIRHTTTASAKMTVVISRNQFDTKSRATLEIMIRTVDQHDVIRRDPSTVVCNKMAARHFGRKNSDRQYPVPRHQ